MGQIFPASVKAVLAQPKVRVVKRVELVRDYWNSNTRLLVDVSDDVAKFGTLTGESTIKSVDWENPGLTVSMNNVSGRYSPKKSSSIWVATFNRRPRECALIFSLLLPLPDGSLYTLHRYPGSIEDCVPREESDIAVVDLVTKHMSHRPLTAKITKASGDELVVIGTGW